MKVVGIFLFVASCSALLPSWTAIKLDPLKPPYGGATPVANRTHSRLYKAVPEIGTYNMSPMIDYHAGQLLAMWKCALQDEDQAGQHILFSQSLDGATWTPTDGKNILFPNMSTTANRVALFAEPALHINGRVYAAASPVQFCLYPDQYFSKLLLRQVYPGVAKFGPIFWAARAIPAGFEEASRINNVTTILGMDAQTQSDIAKLDDPKFAPCDPASGTPKCEYCYNGCQPWADTVNVTGLENERTHYVVPRSNPQADVILYRSRLHKDITEGPNHLYASTRASPTDTWTTPMVTNITDDVANINAGQLPDGRVYLLNNALFTVFRDPLYITVSQDGWHFSSTHVAVSCEEEQFREKGQPWGCLYRYKGGAKEGGVQYPQGIAVTAPGFPNGFYVIYSLNKEDIWVSRLPLGNF